MGSEKLKVFNTQADNLMANLRGEIAEVVTAWILMRQFMASGTRRSTVNVAEDFNNPDLTYVYLLKDKLEDELVARLSELAEKKAGRLNFYFAAEKLRTFQRDASDFSAYIEKNGFRQKRNHDISHKELPEKWEDHRAPLHIPYRQIVRAVAHALRLIERIDRHVLGPSAPYFMAGSSEASIPADPLSAPCPVHVGAVLPSFRRGSHSDCARRGARRDKSVDGDAHNHQRATHKATCVPKVGSSYAGRPFCGP